MSPSRSIGVADAAHAWWKHVSKFEADLTASPDDRSIWGAHDFVAALVIRDAVDEGISRLESDLVRIIKPAISDADQRFLDFTEVDADGSIEKIEGRSAQGRGWWWARIPKRGPIRDEIQRYYGHAKRGE